MMMIMVMIMITMTTLTIKLAKVLPHDMIRVRSPGRQAVVGVL
jgi:hypothetical protein